VPAKWRPIKDGTDGFQGSHITIQECLRPVALLSVRVENMQPLPFSSMPSAAMQPTMIFKRIMMGLLCSQEN
jgi:hypothetical protein